MRAWVAVAVATVTAGCGTANPPDPVAVRAEACAELGEYLRFRLEPSSVPEMSNPDRLEVHDAKKQEIARHADRLDDIGMGGLASAFNRLISGGEEAPPGEPMDEDQARAARRTWKVNLDYATAVCNLTEDVARMRWREEHGDGS